MSKNTLLRYESIWHIDFTDENYSPISRINFAEWNDQTQVKLLQTVGDLDDAREKGLLITNPAQPSTNLLRILN